MHKHGRSIVHHRHIRVATNYAKRWLPITVFAVFCIGGMASFFVAHGQDALTNALHIAELQHDVQDLRDMPIQLGAMRERLVKVEGDVAQANKRLDAIDAKGNWVVFGVFGILLTQVIKGIKFNKDPESGEHVALIKS